LKSRLAGDLDAVDRAQQELQRTIDAAAGLSRRQADRLEQAHKSLEFLAVATARLETLSHGITELRKEVLPHKTRHADAAVFDSGAAVELYTMASERDVHYRLLNEKPEFAQTVPAGAGAEAGSEDDNIEFF
jgi:hypothetical protein